MLAVRRAIVAGAAALVALAPSTATLSLLAAAGPWVTTAGATSAIYNRLLHAYQSTGSINPCAFSSAQLEGALKSVDTYAAQYFADFTNAIESALGQRAAGACVPAPRTVAPGARAATQPAAGDTSATGAPLHPGPLTAATAAGPPEPILILAILSGLLLAVAGVIGTAHAVGSEPRWAAAWTHAWREAGYRIAGAWADVADLVRARR